MGTCWGWNHGEGYVTPIVYLHWKLSWLFIVHYRPLFCLSYVNKQWVLHNLHRESILNKYDHLIQLMEQNTHLWKVDQPQFVGLGLGHTQKWTQYRHRQYVITITHSV